MKCDSKELSDWETATLSRSILSETEEVHYWQEKPERTVLPPSMSELMY